MWEIQLHFIIDNRFEFAAQIPIGPAISPKNDAYVPGIAYPQFLIWLKYTPAIAIEKIIAEIIINCDLNRLKLNYKCIKWRTYLNSWLQSAIQTKISVLFLKFRA